MSVTQTGLTQKGRSTASTNGHKVTRGEQIQWGDILSRRYPTKGRPTVHFVEDCYQFVRLEIEWQRDDPWNDVTFERLVL